MAQQKIILQPGSTQAASASGRFLNIVSCTAQFKVEMDNNGQNVGAAGSQFSTSKPFRRLVFEETQGVVNTIVFDASDDPSPSRPTVIVAASSSLIGSNPGALTNTDPLATSFRDTSLAADPGTYAPYSVFGGTINFGSIFSFFIPANKPYRRIWCFVDASVFPAGEGVYLNFFSGGHPAINPNTNWVQFLPARNKVTNPPYGVPADWGATEYGFAVSKDTDNPNRVFSAGDFYYRNTDGTGTYYRMKPFDLYTLADTIDLGKTAGLGGTVRAFLAILSSELPIT
jgi:hypothetical protein